MRLGQISLHLSKLEAKFGQKWLDLVNSIGFGKNLNLASPKNTWFPTPMGSNKEGKGI